VGVNITHVPQAQPDVTTFSSVFGEMITPEQLDKVCQSHAPQTRTTPKLTAAQVVTGLVYHQLHPSGSLAKNARSLHETGMSDSAFSQRRQGLPLCLFEQIAATALRPMADPVAHPEAFYQGLRLVGVDGTQCSVSNTSALMAALPKAASRRLTAAFAKLQVVTLMELCLHNPLAVVAAPASTGEVTLAKKLWASVADQSLLIIDRGFGTPAGLHEATQSWAGRRVEWLARVRKNLKTRILERLSDGSALVEAVVKSTDKLGKRTKRVELRMREIRFVVVGRDGKRSEVRLWTSLIDHQQYPALELAQNYAKRWEHEVAYRELKLDVRSAVLLNSHTLETALQEVMAVVLAMAAITRVRIAAGERLGVPTLRVSFLKILQLTQQLWQSFAWVQAQRSPSLAATLCQHYFEEVQRRALLPQRRARSCPRVLRQPVSPWPRKTNQPSFSGPVSLSIVNLP
jgi:Transposase DDE domain